MVRNKDTKCGQIIVNLIFRREGDPSTCFPPQDANEKIRGMHGCTITICTLVNNADLINARPLPLLGQCSQLPTL